MRRVASVVVLSVLVPACAGQPSSSRPSSSPVISGVPVTSGSAGPGQVLIAVAETSQGKAGTLTLYRPDGGRVAQVTLDVDTRVLAVAGSRVFIQRGNGHLKAIRRDGAVEDLGSLGAAVRWFAAKPNGTRWIWSTTIDDSAAGTHSAVHLGGDGLAPRVVEELTRPSTVLGPISWTGHGAFVQYGPAGGHGGYFPFGRGHEWLLVEGSVHQLDPEAARVTAMPATFGCTFGDMAADGTIICLPGGPYVRLVSSNGTTNTLSLATPRFNMVGEAYCAPVDAICTVAGATGVGNGMANPNNPQPEQYGTDLVTTNGSISRFGPDGVDPAMGWQSWLPDGSLVLWRRPGAAGAAPGIYVLDRSGHGPFIPATGEPVGYLN